MEESDLKRHCMLLRPTLLFLLLKKPAFGNFRSLSSFRMQAPADEVSTKGLLDRSSACLCQLF